MVNKYPGMNFKYYLKASKLEKFGKYAFVFFALKGVLWLLMLGSVYLQMFH